MNRGDGDTDGRLMLFRRTHAFGWRTLQRHDSEGFIAQALHTKSMKVRFKIAFASFVHTFADPIATKLSRLTKIANSTRTTPPADGPIPSFPHRRSLL